jgi:hypothetical protein
VRQLAFDPAIDVQRAFRLQSAAAPVYAMYLIEIGKLTVDPGAPAQARALAEPQFAIDPRRGSRAARRAPVVDTAAGCKRHARAESDPDLSVRRGS